MVRSYGRKLVSKLIYNLLVNDTRVFGTIYDPDVLHVRVHRHGFTRRVCLFVRSDKICITVLCMFQDTSWVGYP